MKVSAFVLVLVCITDPGFSERINAEAIIIGDTEYFYEAEINFLSRGEAEAYCAAQGSCLAVVDTPDVFNVLVRWLPQYDRFWIDGSDISSIARFELTSSCGGAFDLGGLDPNSLHLDVFSCLMIFHGKFVAASKIYAVPCTGTERALCSFRMGGEESVRNETLNSTK